MPKQSLFVRCISTVKRFFFLSESCLMLSAFQLFKMCELSLNTVKNSDSKRPKFWSILKASGIRHLRSNSRGIFFKLLNEQAKMPIAFHVNEG